MLKRIGAEENGKFKAIASGALPSGKPVVINADGTVSVISETSSTESIGSDAIFESNSNGVTNIGSVYDSDSQKIIVAYRDTGDSFKGKAIVGTVSGSSISFGSEVEFNSGNSQYNQVAYIGSSKVLISFKDATASLGKAIVGTVSGTSISFGTAESVGVNTEYNDAIYDPDTGKAVVFYRDIPNNQYGTARVATISGTSISFGTAQVFESATSNYIDGLYDTANNKVVVFYHDSGNSGRLTGIVGTVSGTDISFGTPANISNQDCYYTSSAYDINSSKCLVASSNASNLGKIVVATVSGTDISFGTPVTFTTGAADWVSLVYHEEAKKHLINWTEGSVGKMSTATVSGTSATVTTATTFQNVNSTYHHSSYDANAKKIVVSYSDNSNSARGTSNVVDLTYTSTTLTSENYIGISKGGAVADTKGATVDIIGAVNDEQSSLTAGQQYFVQTDGTIDTTADDPSVLAGTAISATELLVKT